MLCDCRMISDHRSRTFPVGGVGPTARGIVFALMTTADAASLPPTTPSAPPRRSEQQAAGLAGRLARLVEAPRITGLDIARALAVLGMIIAHVAEVPPFDPSNPVSYLAIVHGNSAILFALLAGISIALMTGRTSIPAPQDLPRHRLRILGRAAVIFLIGLVLEMLGTSIAVILTFYGILFVAAIPFLRLRPRRLLLIAAVLALVAPVLSAAMTQLALNPFAPTASLLISGLYKAAVWLPLMLTGLAIGRLDLTSTKVAGLLIGIGAALLTVATALALVLPMLITPLARSVGLDPALLPPSQVGVLQWGSPDSSGLKGSISGPAGGSGSVGSGGAGAPGAAPGGSSPAPGDTAPGDQAPADTAPGDQAPGGSAPAPTTEEVPGDQVDLSATTCSPSTPDDPTVRCWPDTWPDSTGPEMPTAPDGSSADVDPNTWATYGSRLAGNDAAENILSALLNPASHSGGTLEIIGSGGLAAMVVGLCLLVTGGSRRLRFLLTPLAAVGSMPLTSYTAHILVIFAAVGPGGTFLSALGCALIVLGLLIGCTAWALWRGRGPLESLAARSAQAMARHA